MIYYVFSVMTKFAKQLFLETLSFNLVGTNYAGLDFAMIFMIEMNRK